MNFTGEDFRYHTWNAWLLKKQGMCYEKYMKVYVVTIQDLDGQSRLFFPTMQIDAVELIKKMQ